mgnify:CR=1 FL=1
MGGGGEVRLGMYRGIAAECLNKEGAVCEVSKSREYGVQY